MKVIETTFLAESITTRSNMYVTFSSSQGINDQRNLSGYTKLGRIPAETLRGWLRHAMEKVLLESEISVCHPMPENTITNQRNKEYYQKDLKLGYHPRGKCEKEGGCPIYNIWGDLNKPSNIIVPSVYFYPSLGGGTMANNINKIFGTVGRGRLEITHNSPRVRENSYQTYMTTETIVGTTIQAPFNIVLNEENELHEILILKTLEFLFKNNVDSNFSFMVGGKRSSGYGRAVAVIVNDNGNFLTKGRNSIGIKGDEANVKDQKFQKYLNSLKQKFPIKRK